MKDHKNTALLAAVAMSSMSLLAAPAEAEVLVAGWDSFTSEPESDSPATILEGSTAATMSGGTGGTWNDWNNNTFGASGDGTFGNLDTSVATASTDVGTGSGQDTNLSLNRSQKPGELVFSLVNNSGADRAFQGFYFDGAARFSQSARDWELTFDGAISGAPVSDTLGNNNMMSLSDAERNWGIDLTTALTDNVWEAGSTATFTIVFTGGDTSTGTGGGQETVIDNIGITIVPEPTSLALLSLGGLLVARRRRA